VSASAEVQAAYLGAGATTPHPALSPEGRGR